MAKNRLSESVSASTSVPNTEKSKSVYFPNLNGVRFIAAFSVLVHHIEQAKAAFGLPNLYSNHIEQAKAMEKEQMFDYIKKNYINGEHSLKFHKEEFEQYYNETYGK